MKTLIVLISGTGLRSDLRLLRYWGKVPKMLRRYGFEVAMICPDSFGSISKNVETISGELNKVLKNNTFKETHVFGHSRGGIEALYLTQDQSIAQFITSITMLNSPVTGHNKAKKVAASTSVATRFLYWFSNLLGRMQGDKHPDSKKLVIELSLNHMDRLFIETHVPVYLLQSELRYNELPFVWKIISRIFYPKSQLGDGLVPYQDIRKHNIIEIPSRSIADQPFTHTSPIAITKMGRLSKTDLNKVWENLINTVVLKSNQ